MYCEVCGVPLGITRGNIWHADGSITGRYPPYIKGTFFDADELEFLFHSLSNLMEYDIGDIVASGKYHDTREYMSATLERMKEASGGTLPPEDELYRMMLYPACIWGVASVEFASIEPEKKVIRVKEPYSVHLLRGDVAGVADMVTGREHVAIWEGEESEGIITLVPGEGYKRTSGLLDEGSVYGVKHEAEELECEHCHECGAPLGISRLLKWDRQRCRIEEKFSGRRYCFSNSQGIVAVLRMLIGELGEDIEYKILDIAREYSRYLYEEISGQPESNGGRGSIDLESQLKTFPYRGWGYVAEVSSRDDAWLVDVENPYNEIMLSGRLWGMLEASTGRDLRIMERAMEGLRLRLSFAPS
jgi:hypothetical protein